ncbi:hypothetical protein Tco_0976191 [Tanacetum coccineum]|uniref:Uncharacterized protein n=1 Tax=Tanacetum coccineum TaxID=301880 RepID=A0ABQ5EGI1_9ASTR
MAEKILKTPMDLSSCVDAVKRYTPPNQRDQTNSYVSDGDKVQEDRSDPPSLIALKGCCSSEAYQLLNNRWAAAMSAYENPSTDLSEKPVMYAGSGATEVEGSSHQIDFLSELRKAMKHLAYLDHISILIIHIFKPSRIHCLLDHIL